MLDSIKTEDVLFLDIETVPGSPSYETLILYFRRFGRRIKTVQTPEQLPADVYERAGIYSEFGKIICISVA